MILNNTPIQIEWFYFIEGDKSKLNWYLLEISLEYYDRIMGSQDLSAYREEHNETQIALYCAYYARRLKKSLLNYIRRRNKTVIFYQEYVSDYYPQYEDNLTLALSRTARASFDHMWPVCMACPQQCLWEHEDTSPLFDEYKA
jgi:molybdopterin-guanine dinucleotide biosynthesis protein A